MRNINNINLINVILILKNKNIQEPNITKENNSKNNQEDITKEDKFIVNTQQKYHKKINFKLICQLI